MRPGQKLLSESHVIAIHPSGRVYAVKNGVIFELKLNPRATVIATMDECGVEDFEGLASLPLSKLSPTDQNPNVFKSVPTG